MLLPPKIAGPLDNLSTFVVVLGALEGATVQLFANGSPVGIPSLATGLSVLVPLAGAHLTPGQTVTATQASGLNTSPPSPPEPVGAAPVDLPPVTFLSLPHPCVDWVLLGGMVAGVSATILWKGKRIGTAVAQGSGVSVPVSFPTPASAGDVLEAFQSYSSPGGASVQGPTSTSLPLGRAPVGEPPAPSLAPPYECDLAVLVSGLQDGASLTIKHNAKELAGYPYLGGATWAELEKPVAAGETLSGKQESRGCHRQGPFSNPPVGVNPATGLPTPVVGGPVCPNAAVLHVSNLRPGADVWIQTMKDPNTGILIPHDMGHVRAWATECEFPLPAGWADDPTQAAIKGKFTIQLSESNCGKAVVVSALITPLPGAVGTPAFSPAPVECTRIIHVINLTPGAMVTLHSDQGDFPQLSAPAWVSSAAMTLYPYRPLRYKEFIWISQRGCNAAADSDHPQVGAMPALAAPGQEPPIIVPRGGAWFRDLVVGGRLYVFLNGALATALDISSDRMFAALPGLKIEDQVWAIQGLCTKYSPESSHEAAKGGTMKVGQAPSPIERGKSVSVTITATDAQTSDAVNGSVRISGAIAAATGSAFAVNIAKGAAGPPAQVEAVGYISGAIKWNLVDPPPPPAAKLHLAVINQSGGAFKIAGVTWTVWQQTISGFSQLAMVNGESVTVQPSASGQYQIHADVVVTRIATGYNELSEFRGTATGPGGASTLVIAWAGADQLRTFRLVTEAQTANTGGGYFTIYNPVVVL